MYLHLGQDVVVPTASIIGIFDLENTSQSKVTRAFLEKAQKTGAVVNVGEEIPKSFSVCLEKGKIVVYISQISAATLYKRCSGGFESL